MADDWMARVELEAFKRAFSGKALGPSDEDVNEIQARKLTRREHEDHTHDLAFTELAEQLAEEVFAVVERENRLVKADIALAIAKTLALSRWRHTRRGER